MGKELKYCCICNISNKTNQIEKERYGNNYYCKKHREQLIKYNKITNPEPPLPVKLRYCEICGISNLETRVYDNKKHNMTICGKHLLQLNRKGKILKKTIFDENDTVDHGEYMEIITRDAKGKLTGSTYIDKEDYPKIKNYKIYRSKNYARINIGDGKKRNLHNFIMDCPINMKVDHIRIDKIDGIVGTLDNRRSNLRFVNTQKNSFNIHKDITKGNKVCKKTGRFSSIIMVDYKGIWLGKYDTFEEAKTSRVLGEVYYFKEYRDFIHDLKIFDMYKTLNNNQIENILKNIKKHNIIYSVKEVENIFLKLKKDYFIKINLN